MSNIIEQNPRIETVDYYCQNGKVNTVIALADYNLRVMVIKEHAIAGPSLTNTIEEAIMACYKAIYWRKSNRGGYQIKDWTVLQDCGEEGFFKVSFDLEKRTGMTTNGGGMFEKETITNPKWEYFSKDLKTFEVLYGKGGL